MGSGNSSQKAPDPLNDNAATLSQDEKFGPKIVQLFNFIEDIRGSKDNSISWTELEDFFKKVKGMGLSEAVRHRKETMSKFDKNDDNRISLHEFRTYIDECAHHDWSDTRLKIQQELNIFEEKVKEHEKHRANELRKHEDKPGFIASIKLSDDTTITPEDILDCHLFHEHHSTAPRDAGVAPKGATHLGVFNWIRNVLASEPHTETIEKVLNHLMANRRLWRDPNNSGQRDFSDLQKACRTARHRIGQFADKEIYVQKALGKELGHLGRQVRYKLPSISPRYLYSSEDTKNHVDWKLMKHLDDTPCVGGAELEYGALVLAQFTNQDGEPSERYYEAIVTKCHSTTHYELLYFTKEITGKAHPRQDHYLPPANSDLLESDQLYLVGCSCLALAFMPLVSKMLSKSLDDLAVEYEERPLIGCCGKPAHKLATDGICSIRPLHSIFRELAQKGGGVANAHVPRPAAVIDYIRSVVVCKDLATLAAAYEVVCGLGLVVGVVNRFTPGYDAVDSTGGCRYVTVKLLIQHGGDHVEEGNLDFSWGVLFDLDETKESWKTWLSRQTGSVKRGYKEVEGWLKHKRVRDNQAMFMITVELHLQDYKDMVTTWPFKPLTVIIDAQLPKSLYTRYVQSKAATKIQATQRGRSSRKDSVAKV